MNRIVRLARHSDRLQSDISKKEPAMRKRQRYKLRVKRLRLHQKIRNLVGDLHHRLAAYLCKNYDHILLPKFDTQGMVQREDATTGRHRVINSSTARAMCTWSHYLFRQRLLHRARFAPGCRVHVVDEAYTTKTCGRCGHVRAAFPGETFHCPNCGLRSDRDAHAARNILIRAVARHPPTMAAAPALPSSA